MKTFPAFIASFLDSANLPESNKEKFLAYFSLWNNVETYSPLVRWFEDGKPVAKKFSLYKLPELVNGSFARWGKKKYNSKETDVIWSQIVRSDYGMTLPLSKNPGSVYFQSLQDLENILLSFPESFHSPKIFLSDEGRKHMLSVSSGKDFEVLISGSVDATVSERIYLFWNGLILPVSTTNRHTLNFSAKQKERFADLEELLDEFLTYSNNFEQQAKLIKGSFDEFYSRILLKGSAISSLQSSKRSLGVYNEIKSFYSGEKTLYGFFKACQSKDLAKLENDPTKVIKGSFKQYSDIVRKYGETKAGLQKLAI